MAFLIKGLFKWAELIDEIVIQHKTVAISNNIIHFIATIKL